LSLIALMVASLAECNQAQSETASSDPVVKALVQRSLANMVFVKGGTFMMGDFGSQVTPEKLPFTAQKENKPLHKVDLDDFSISKYKVTYADFDIYTAVTGTPPWPRNAIDQKYKMPDYPAGVSWQAARDYCQWLGKQSAKSIDLPTEAQWEYAARNGGKFVRFATDNGQYDLDRNVPSVEQIEEKLSKDGKGGYGTYPIGKFPATPLGLYDVGFDGREWVSDWFAADYYEHSSAKNPTGPSSGSTKILRGEEGDAQETAMTAYRDNVAPIKPSIKWKDGTVVEPEYVTDTFRCVIRSGNPP